MDTKSKSNPKIGFLVSFLILSLFAVGGMLSYGTFYRYAQKLSLSMEKETRENAEASSKNEFIEELFQGNYSLYWDLQKKVRGSQVTPSEIMLNKTIYNDETNASDTGNGGDTAQGDFTGEDTAAFDRVFKTDWHDRFLTLTVNNFQLDYYIVDNKTGDIITNTDKPLQLLLDDSQNAEELKKNYSFYAAFSYKETGAVEVPVFYGMEDSYKSNYLSLEYDKSPFQNGSFYTGEWSGDRIICPSDATIIYASKGKDLFASSSSEYNENWMKWSFHNGGFYYVYFFAILGTLLAALVLPVRKSWRLGEGIAAKLPFEAAAILGAALIAPYEGLLYLGVNTAAGTLIDRNLSAFPVWLNKALAYGINYLVWMCVLVGWFVCFLSLRQILTLGPLRYLKEKTAVIIFCAWVKNILKKWFRYFSRVDLRDPAEKIILKILGANFLVLAILCSIWFAGIAGLVLYSALLYLVMKKYVSKWKKNYTILLDAAGRMADGNLEIVIEEDLGIFEPLKEELTRVQFGFKKAVEEEMKSQKMKSELITNVSHDLKTPLTAIITYIGLLKDTEVTQEERNSYIETLDHKSQRLKVLIEDLFEISKASSNNITLNLVEVDLGSLIKQVLFELDQKIKASEIEFRLQMPEEKLLLRLDSEKTYRIFENLIVNIVKYGLAHTRAYIEVKTAENQVQVTLKNISAAEPDFNPDEICERFARGDKARNTEGSGLGLAIAKSFTQLQGGTFQVITDGDLFKVVITWITE